MTMFLFLVFLIVVVAFVATRNNLQPVKLVGNVKKAEAAVAKTLDVNGDGKVDLKDVVAAAEVVKKIRKPRAKKITPKKKN